MTTSANDDELLLHLPEYGVIICRSCRYAIQPHALESHLLGHHIYRSHRQQLLSRLAGLKLLEPDAVSLPPADTSPFPDLPLLNGYICLHDDCSRSCVSQKRMELHWSKDHDEKNSKYVQARAAKLQTFFRGNKVHYFEVKDSTSMEIAATHAQDASTGDSAGLIDSAPRTLDTDGIDDNLERTPSLDLQDMRYFHHYRNAPCPVPHEKSTESQSFWDIDLYELAFTHEFLMYAILGYAATDMAMGATNVHERKQHHVAAMRYQSIAMSIFRQEVQHPDANNSLALVACARFIGVLQLILQQLEESTCALQGTSCADAQNLGLANVIEAFYLFRGTEQLILSLRHLLPSSAEFLMHITQPDKCCVSTAATDLPMNLSGPSHYLERIRILPPHLAGSDLICDEIEVETIEQATVALLAVVSRNFAATEADEKDIAAHWDGLGTFALSVPDHFVAMLRAHHPAALILFAHKRPLLLALEDSHFFMRGRAAHELEVIRRNLRPEHVVFVKDLEQAIS